MSSGPKAKSVSTQEHVVIRRVEAARRRMLRAVKKGKVLKGPAPRRLRIRA